MNAKEQQQRLASQTTTTTIVTIPFPLFHSITTAVFFQFKLATLFILLFTFHLSILSNNNNNSNAFVATAADAEQLPPVILVHGFLGSKLYVSGDNIEYPDGHKCTLKQTSYHKAWISKAQLVRNKECEFYWMGLNYNNASGTFKNRAGIDLSFENQRKENASIDSIQCLWMDWSYYCSIPYFQSLVYKLKQIGYSENVNLLAAVYDWRQHPTAVELDNFYYGLKRIIVAAVRDSGKKVVLIAHSYGNILINHFFQAWTDQKWLEAHIESTINVAAPFGGSAYAVHGLMVGEDQVFARITFIPAIVIRNFMRSLVSPTILLPRPEAFNSSQVFVRIANFESYTVENIEQMLQMAESEHLWPIYERFSITPNGRENIPMHCVYAVNKKSTPMEMRFDNKQDFDDGKEPTIVYGDGDGTVNIESLRVCQQWMEREEIKNITVKEISGPDHESILQDKRFLDHVVNLLLMRKTDGKEQTQQKEMLADGTKHWHFLAQQQRRIAYTHPVDGLLCISEQCYAACPNGMRPKRWTKAIVHFACFDPTKTGTGKFLKNALARQQQERNDQEENNGNNDDRIDQLILKAKREQGNERMGKKGKKNWLTRWEGRTETIPLECI